jgi:hypothetical protein
MMEEKKPAFIFQKNVDKATNKMIIPKFIVKQWGESYSMEVYEDCIVLRPIRKEQ